MIQQLQQFKLFNYKMFFLLYVCKLEYGDLFLCPNHTRQ